VFTARYELSPYIKQTRNSTVCVCSCSELTPQQTIANITFHCVTYFHADPSGRACLRRRSAAESLLGSWVRIPRGGMDVCLVQCLCCQVEVSATGRFPVQRSPTYCGVCLSVIKCVLVLDYLFFLLFLKMQDLATN
jgi:hypothetical protein